MQLSTDKTIKLKYNKKQNNYILPLNFIGSHTPFVFPVADFSYDDTNAIFVKKTGNDGNAGTQASPKLTVAAAISATSSAKNKVIVIDNGVYLESLQSATYTNCLGVYNGTGYSASYTNRTAPYSDTDTNTVYINGTSGSDSNTGTLFSPVKTIDKALTLVTATKANLMFVAGGEYTLKSQALSANLDGMFAYPGLTSEVIINIETQPILTTYQHETSVITNADFDVLANPSTMSGRTAGTYALIHQLGSAVSGDNAKQHFKLIKYNPDNILNPSIIDFRNFMTFTPRSELPTDAGQGYGFAYSILAATHNENFAAFAIAGYMCTTDNKIQRGINVVIFQGTSIYNIIDLGDDFIMSNIYNIKCALGWNGNDLVIATAGTIRTWNPQFGLQTVSSGPTRPLEIYKLKDENKLLLFYDSVGSFIENDIKCNIYNSINYSLLTSAVTVGFYPSDYDTYFINKPYFRWNGGSETSLTTKAYSFNSTSNTFTLYQTYTGYTLPLASGSPRILYSLSKSLDGVWVELDGALVSSYTQMRTRASVNGYGVTASSALEVNNLTLFNSLKMAKNITLFDSSSTITSKWVTYNQLDVLATVFDCTTPTINNNLIISGGSCVIATTAGTITRSAFSSATDYALKIAGAGAFTLTNSIIFNSSKGLQRTTAGAGDTVRDNIFNNIATSGIVSATTMPVTYSILNCSVSGISEGTGIIKRNPLFVYDINSSLLDLRLRRKESGYLISSPAIGSGTSGADISPYIERVLVGEATYSEVTLRKPEQIDVNYKYSISNNKQLLDGTSRSSKTGQTEYVTLNWGGIITEDYEFLNTIWRTENSDIRVYWNPETDPSTYYDYTIFRDEIGGGADNYKFHDVARQNISFKMFRKVFN